MADRTKQCRFNLSSRMFYMCPDKCASALPLRWGREVSILLALFSSVIFRTNLTLLSVDSLPSTIIVKAVLEPFLVMGHFHFSFGFGLANVTSSLEVVPPPHGLVCTCITWQPAYAVAHGRDYCKIQFLLCTGICYFNRRLKRKMCF